MAVKRPSAKRVAVLGVVVAAATAIVAAATHSAGAASADVRAAAQSSMAIPKLSVLHLGEDYVQVQLAVGDTVTFSSWVQVNGEQHCLNQLQPGDYQIECVLDLAPGSVSELIATSSDPLLGTHTGSDILVNPAAVDAPYFFDASASATGATTETISANVDPEGATTTWHVEYGPSASLGTSTPGQSVAGAPGGRGGTPSQAALSGLAAGTTYYYVLVGTNASGTTTTPVATFTAGGGTTTTTATTTAGTTTAATTTTAPSPPVTTAAPPVGGSTPRATAVSHSIRLAKRTKSADCTRGPNPDRRCSPGAYDSLLTKADICAPSFHGASGVSAATKRAVEAEYGMSPRSSGRAVEIDRIVGVELGGTNDIANLFPEPRSGKANYRVKDRLEQRLHTLVCSGRMPLRTAQTGIARNWQTLYRRVFGVAPQRLSR